MSATLQTNITADQDDSCSAKAIKIVVIDDDVQMTEHISNILGQSRRYKVISYNSPTVALASIASDAPDFLILDICMPLLDGGDVLALIRQKPGFATIPAIFLSTLISPDEASDAGYIKSGGEIMVPKPIKSADLLFALIDSMTQ